MNLAKKGALENVVNYINSISIILNCIEDRIHMTFLIFLKNKNRI